MNQKSKSYANTCQRYNCQMAYKGKVLEVDLVDQFKYLGFIVHKCGILKLVLKKLLRLA